MPKIIETSDSSDDLSENSVTEKIKYEHAPKPQILPKKRGRPRKNVTQSNVQAPTKTQSTEKKKQLQNEEIILHLEIYDDDDDTSEKNVFTMGEDSDNKYTSKPILSLSNNSSESESDSDSNSATGSTRSIKLKNKSLQNELKKKDTQIKKLKSSINDMKSNKCADTIICTSKDMKSKVIDLKLINVNDNKLILADTTNISCWWCTEQFNTLPCFIPARYSDDKYYVFGCFCTYSCAKAYNSSMDEHRTPIRTALINKLCAAIFGNTDPIPLAPPREMLQKFGGPLTIHDFRNGSLLCKKEFKSTIPPIIPLVQTYDELNKDSGGNNRFGGFAKSTEHKEITNRGPSTMGKGIVKKSESVKHDDSESDSDSESSDSSDNESKQSEKQKSKVAKEKQIKKKTAKPVKKIIPKKQVKTKKK